MIYANALSMPLDNARLVWDPVSGALQLRAWKDNGDGTYTVNTYVLGGGVLLDSVSANSQPW